MALPLLAAASVTTMNSARCANAEADWDVEDTWIVAEVVARLN
jgi:hypothetical protein